MESEKVELHLAHTWDCPSCGKENFCRGVTSELSEEDKQELREIAARDNDCNPEDVDPRSPGLQTGFWITAPTEVTCAYCGKEFETLPEEE